jgi:hypothetical protein
MGSSFKRLNPSLIHVKFFEKVIRVSICVIFYLFERIGHRCELLGDSAARGPGVFVHLYLPSQSQLELITSMCINSCSLAHIGILLMIGRSTHLHFSLGFTAR